MKTRPYERNIYTKKMSAKTTSRTTLSSIRREMAEPHRAESTKKGADTFANGGHLTKD